MLKRPDFFGRRSNDLTRKKESPQKIIGIVFHELAKKIRSNSFV